MKAPQVEFDVRPAPARRTRLGVAALVVIAAISAGSSIHAWSRWRDAEASLRAVQMQAQARGESPVPAYDASARRMLVEHELAWPDLLGRLESASRPGTKPVGLTYSAMERIARIELRAGSYGSVVDYLRQLSDGASTYSCTLSEMRAAAQDGSLLASIHCTLALHERIPRSPADRTPEFPDTPPNGGMRNSGESTPSPR